jgi:membrane dipeptidase
MKRSVRTHFISTAALAAATLLAACGGTVPEPSNTATEETETEAEMTERARGIHERAITLDTHDDITVSNFTPERNYTTDLGNQVNLPKMEAGGLDVAWFVVFTGQGDLDDDGYAAAYENAIAKFNAIHWLTEEGAPERIRLAYTSDDVRRLDGEGKKIAMIGIENAYPVGLDLDNIRDFAERGARYMSLAHNGHSQFADSNTGERDDVWLHDGLSELGREAIVEMNKWGIMIDLSHPAKTSNMQTLELTRAPVIASHSSARAVNNVSRNLDDEELRAIEANGGVVQTVAFSSYVNSEKHAAHREAMSAIEAEIAADMGFEILERSAVGELPDTERETYMEQRSESRRRARERIDEIADATPPVNVADFADHIDYLVELIGLEHVGISSDFDGGGGVYGWNDASETFNVTLELVRRGYTDEQIGMLWSGNLLRVLDEVQRIAAEIQAGES